MFFENNVFLFLKIENCFMFFGCEMCLSVFFCCRERKTILKNSCQIGPCFLFYMLSFFFFFFFGGVGGGGEK